MVLQNAAGDEMPVWEAEAMYSPMDLFIQQIVFQCETHTVDAFPVSLNDFIQLIMYKPGMYALL